MSIAATLLPEFDHEVISARRTLERVPADKFDWKPHAKSYTMGTLAAHLANLPIYAVSALRDSELDFAALTPEMQTPKITSTEELLAEFDRTVAAAREHLAKAPDAVFAESWTMRAGEQVFLTMPKASVVRSVVISHLIHHRAQLGVYLRLNDIPVPSVYGPSADEQM